MWLRRGRGGGKTGYLLLRRTPPGCTPCVGVWLCNAELMILAKLRLTVLTGTLIQWPENVSIG